MVRIQSHMDKKYRYFTIIVLMIMQFTLGCNPSNNTPYQTTEPKDNQKQTQTITPTINVTPLTIPNPNNKEKEILELMKENNNCLGFCFLGIVPGVTSFQNAIDFLGVFTDKKLTMDEDGNVQYNHAFTYDEQKIAVSVMFSDINGFVENLIVSIDGVGRSDVSENDWIAFRPDNYLRKSSQPQEVFVVMSQGPEGRLGYGFYFVYPAGYIYYNGNQTIILPDHIMNACPLKPNHIDGIKLESRIEGDRLLPRGIAAIDQVSSLSKKDVYQLLLGNPDEACFEIDYDLFLIYSN